MDTYVRDNNKEKLNENFSTFIELNKKDLQKEFQKNMRELIHEQRRRIETFDIIFSNLIGAFYHIFKEYFSNEQDDTNIKKFLVIKIL